MLGTILIVVAAIVLFLVVAATRPADYRVVRTIEIAAPAEVVFAPLNDLRRFADVLVFFGEPLKADPKLELRFQGPEAGIGQSIAWSGKDAGQGTLTVKESVAAQKVGLELEFVKPMASRAIHALGLQTTATGSSVTWAMEGKHNFLGKAFGLFMNMDKALGSDLEKALSRLKTIAEDAGAKRPLSA